MFKYQAIRPQKRVFALIIVITAAWIFFFLESHSAHGISREVQRFQASYNSFSSISQLVDNGGDELYGKGTVLPAINKLKMLAKIIIQDTFAKTKKIEEIQLFIKFKNLEKIYSDREKALRNGKILADAQSVPCKVKSGKSEFKCKVRLKGHYADHWAVKKRMSLRVEVKGGFILGMKEFSIQKPAVRQYPYDYHFQEAHSKFGGLSSDKQKFVSVIFNGSNWGTMNVEEAITEKFIERRARKVSPIFEISDQKSWPYLFNPSAPQPYFISDPTITLSVSGSDKKFMENPRNRSYYSHIISRMQNQDFDLFDREKLLNSFLIALVWGGTHTLYPSNSKYYWNTYSLRLEPILSDQVLA
ncbi:hypothetical protein OAW67_00875 [Planktomarina sp.]|nr:hypothetical protein [Planktomarina sp.]